MPLGTQETVGHVWVKVHADGSGLDREIKDDFDDLGPTYKSAGDDNAKSYSEGFFTRFRKDLEGIRKEVKDNDRKLGKKDALGERFRLALVRAELFWGSVRTKGRKAFDSLREGFRDIDSATRTFSRLGRAMDDFATRAGRLSGKGSRNNLFNLFGGLVEQGVRLIGILPKVASGFTGLFGSGGGGGGGAQLAALASSAASSLAGVAIALVAITAIAAPVAAALSGIAAVLVSLTSVAVFAAAAVGGVALALGATFLASVGVAILAIKNLDDQTKKSFGGIKDRFKELGQSAGTAIGPGLRRAAGILDKTFANPRIEKLIDGIAAALGRVAVEFAKVTEGAPFRKFVDSMTVFIPNAIDKLGQITANFGEAFMGVLRALEPITNRFLNWLVIVSQRFSDWANSAAGQNALKDFFDRAADSAADLGGLIADAAKAIGELLSAGNESGNTIVQDLRNQLQRFVRFMQNPKNRDSIREFFQNGIEVARAFGRALAAAGRLFDALDGPRSRAAFQFIMGALGRLFDYWTFMTRQWSRLGGSIINFWTKFKNAATTAFDKVKAAGQDILDFFQGLPDKIADAFSGLAGKILDAIGTIDLSSLISFPGGKIGQAIRNNLTASGGVFTGAQSRIIGEAGPEAVVPLNRPLNQVDPSVRALSAVAQGLPIPGGSSVSTNNNSAVTINVTTPAADARAVALETVNYLAAQGY